MNTKTLIAVAVGTIVAFFAGWVIWGMLLMGYYEENCHQYEGMMIDPPIMWALVLGNLAGAALLGYLFERMNVSTFADGFITGAIIYLLFAISMDMMFYSMMNWFKGTTIIIVDILVNAGFGGLVGGIMALVMGKMAAKG